MLLALWTDTPVGLTDIPEFVNPQKLTLPPFGSLPLTLTKFIIVGPTMLLNLSAHAEFLAIAITSQLKIGRNPMVLRNEACAEYWKVFEQLCTIVD